MPSEFTLTSKRDKSFSIKVTALVVHQVTGKTSSHTIEPTAKLPDIDYADANFVQSTSVDIILGGDIYPAI